MKFFIFRRDIYFAPYSHSHLIHSAAAVRFNEPLRVAMEMNVVAVRHVVALVIKI